MTGAGALIFKEGELIVCCACAHASGPLYKHIYAASRVPCDTLCSRCFNPVGRQECLDAAKAMSKELENG